MQQRFLTVKLAEMNRQHSKAIAGIQICQNSEINAIQKEKQRIDKETEEQNLLLKEEVGTARSKAVSALADAQISYNKNIEDILINVLPESMTGKGTAKEQLAEEKMLYAEFSIDFAEQAIRNAYAASLDAIEKQIEYEKWRNEHE